jgi:hypothetical protein
MANHINNELTANGVYEKYTTFINNILIDNKVVGIKTRHSFHISRLPKLDNSGKTEMVVYTVIHCATSKQEAIIARFRENGLLARMHTDTVLHVQRSLPLI